MNAGSLKVRIAYFLSRLRAASRWDGTQTFFDAVNNWFARNSAGEDGVADIHVWVFCTSDFSDRIINTVRTTARALGMAFPRMSAEMRYKPKVIDGVVYVAQDNCIDVGMKVDLNTVKIPEGWENEYGEDA